MKDRRRHRKRPSPGKRDAFDAPALAFFGLVGAALQVGSGLWVRALSGMPQNGWEGLWRMTNRALWAFGSLGALALVLGAVAVHGSIRRRLPWLELGSAILGSILGLLFSAILVVR